MDSIDTPSPPPPPPLLPSNVRETSRFLGLITRKRLNGSVFSHGRGGSFQLLITNHWVYFSLHARCASLRQRTSVWPRASNFSIGSVALGFTLLSGLKSLALRRISKTWLMFWSSWDGHASRQRLGKNTPLTPRKLKSFWIGWLRKSEKKNVKTRVSNVVQWPTW